MFTLSRCWVFEVFRSLSKFVDITNRHISLSLRPSMHKIIPLMKFIIQSFLVVLTTTFMLFHEVQGMHILYLFLSCLSKNPSYMLSTLYMVCIWLMYLIREGIRHRTMISSVSLDHQTVSVSVPWTSSDGVKSGNPAIMAKKIVVIRTRSTLSSGIAASEKKPQQHQHHNHWMPRIHEDYFGPRHHRPTHHWQSHYNVMTY